MANAEDFKAKLERENALFEVLERMSTDVKWSYIGTKSRDGDVLQVTNRIWRRKSDGMFLRCEELKGLLRIGTRPERDANGSFEDCFLGYPHVVVGAF